METLKVVIVGGGFGGLTVARALRSATLEITVIDKSNHHLFQPLLYQVATASLSPASIAGPIRSILSKQRNAEVIMDEVIGVETSQKKVITKNHEVSYDVLVLATGARHSYFGHPDWEEKAPGLKTIPDATYIRRKILKAFEEAEMETDAEKRNALLTFVIVGGGPTGVELAGAIAELSHKVLARDFRRMDPSSAKIILVEAGERILSSFPEKLSKKAERALKKLHVEIKTGMRLTRVEEGGVGGENTFISSQTVLWAAGVVASPVAQWLKVPAVQGGRVKTTPYLTLENNSDVFIIGDVAFFEKEGKPLPGIAPVAMQEGKYVAHAIKTRLEKRELKPFQYLDKGNLATIGRGFAVAQIGKFSFSGRLAWWVWVFVHIYYLIGFRNRILVLLEWAWAYFTFQRGARLITEEWTPTLR